MPWRRSAAPRRTGRWRRWRRRSGSAATSWSQPTGSTWRRPTGERPAIRDRLTLDDARTDALSAAVLDIAALPDPAGAVLRTQTLENGLRLTKLRVPLGVVLIVYEARPNVTVDAAMLCLKAGNACILRGSRLAEHTNRALTDLMRETLSAAGLPADAVQLLGTDRAELNSLLADPTAADVVIPRGGEELKKFLLETSRIPVLAAAGGNCHVYVDAAADPAKAIAITVNAKVQRPGVCNAAETVLVHRDQEQLVGPLTEALAAEGVEVLDGESGLGDRVPRHEDRAAGRRRPRSGARAHRPLRHRALRGDRDRGRRRRRALHA